MDSFTRHIARSTWIRRWTTACIGTRNKTNQDMSSECPVSQNYHSSHVQSVKGKHKVIKELHMWNPQKIVLKLRLRVNEVRSLSNSSNLVILSFVFFENRKKNVIPDFTPVMHVEWMGRIGVCLPCLVMGRLLSRMRIPKSRTWTSPLIGVQIIHPSHYYWVCTVVKTTPAKS